MLITLKDVLLALGGQAIFLGAVGWLIKVLVSHRLTKEAEEFKIRLQSDANVEIEKLRASLQQTATEHQIRFAKLHEKRAEVIAELHAQLIEAQSHVGRFIFRDARDKELGAEVNTKMWNLFRFIRLNRIYLPESVCELLHAFESALRKSLLDVDLFWTRIPDYSNVSP
jgi:hypothetical protein